MLLFYITNISRRSSNGITRLEYSQNKTLIITISSQESTSRFLLAIFVFYILFMILFVLMQFRYKILLLCETYIGNTGETFFLFLLSSASNS